MSSHWRGSTRRARLPAGWANVIVPRILARDGRICYLCRGPGADAVDHITPGDDHRDENLGAVHENVPPYCHRSKSAREGNAANAARLARGRHQVEPHPGLR